MGRLTPPRALVDDDDVARFDCGRPALNHWLARHAKRNQKSGGSRTYITADSTSRAIAGYVSLSATHVIRAYLPKATQRNQPDSVPAMLIGQLAVAVDWQGRGLARTLLRFALETAITISDNIGCAVVVTHPLDDKARAFYAQFGFVDLPGDPARAMAVRLNDLRASGFGYTTNA